MCVCVCVVGAFSSYLNARILHLFQDFELAVFKPFRGNAEYVEFWGPMLNQNVLLSAEMLNMLNMLNFLGRPRR